MDEHRWTAEALSGKKNSDLNRNTFNTTLHHMHHTCDVDNVPYFQTVELNGQSSLLGGHLWWYYKAGTHLHWQTHSELERMGFPCCVKSIYDVAPLGALEVKIRNEMGVQIVKSRQCYISTVELSLQISSSFGLAPPPCKSTNSWSTSPFFKLLTGTKRKDILNSLSTIEKITWYFQEKPSFCY